MAGDIVEQYVLSHPACAQNQAWFALADLPELLQVSTNTGKATAVMLFWFWRR